MSGPIRVLHDFLRGFKQTRGWRKTPPQTGALRATGFPHNLGKVTVLRFLGRHQTVSQSDRLNFSHLAVQSCHRWAEEYCYSSETQEHILLKGVVTPPVLCRTCLCHVQREQHCVFTWETAGKTDCGTPGFNSQLCLRQFRSHIVGEPWAQLLFRPTTSSTDLVLMCNKGPQNSHGQRDPVAGRLGYCSGEEDKEPVSKGPPTYFAFKSWEQGREQSSVYQPDPLWAKPHCLD